MIEYLKHRLITWLGLATKTELINAFENAIHCTKGIVERRVPELVQDELDKDERTLVFNSSITVNPVIELEEERQARIVQKMCDQKLREAIAAECKPGGILRK